MRRSCGNKFEGYWRGDDGLDNHIIRCS